MQLHASLCALCPLEATRLLLISIQRGFGLDLCRCINIRDPKITKICGEGGRRSEDGREEKSSSILSSSRIRVGAILLLRGVRRGGGFEKEILEEERTASKLTEETDVRMENGCKLCQTDKCNWMRKHPMITKICGRRRRRWRRENGEGEAETIIRLLRI